MFDIMRYFSYNGLTNNSENAIITMSEEEIRKNYYPLWLKKMYDKFGKQRVDEIYCFDDCLDEWCVENSAWESKD